MHNLTLRRMNNSSPSKQSFENNNNNPSSSSPPAFSSLPPSLPLPSLPSSRLSTGSAFRPFDDGLNLGLTPEHHPDSASPPLASPTLTTFTSTSSSSTPRPSQAQSRSPSVTPTATSFPLSPTSSEHPSNSPRTKMLSRNPEPEYTSTRALSRFLRVTGPDNDEDPNDFGLVSPNAPYASSTTTGFGPGRPRQGSFTLSNSLTLGRSSATLQRPSTQPATTHSHNHNQPVSSTEYFKALDARLDMFDDDTGLGLGGSSSRPSTPKSIRKTKSIGESLSLRNRPRSHSTNTRVNLNNESLGTSLGVGMLPPPPATPPSTSASSQTFPISASSTPMTAPTRSNPLSSSSPISSSSNSNSNPILASSTSSSRTLNNMKNTAEGIVASILKRKKSSSAASAKKSGALGLLEDGKRKGKSRHRAGIGSDDYFVSSESELKGSNLG